MTVPRPAPGFRIFRSFHDVSAFGSERHFGHLATMIDNKPIKTPAKGVTATFKRFEIYRYMFGLGGRGCS
jgi:hypothetical protein